MPRRPSRRSAAAFQRLCLMLLFIGGSLWPTAQAKDENEAEHHRLSDDIAKLAKRQVWEGVESKFRDLERLGTEPTYDDLVHGATAARELGDVQHCYQRLKKAVKLETSKDVIEWLWDIDNNYGHVELLTVPSRSAVLEVSEFPFDPNQRKSVDAAIESARRDGIFVGMLPKGSYTFATQSFQVEPGLAVRIEVSPRIRRQGLIDPVIIYRDEYGNPIRTGGDKATDDDSTDDPTEAAPLPLESLDEPTPDAEQDSPDGNLESP